MNDFWKEEQDISQELSLVHDLINNTVDKAQGFIRPVLLSHVQTQGKMLRPALVLIVSNLNKEADRKEAIRIASVIEMIHLASLVHDDIIDSAQKRRGKVTIFAQVGAKQAVLAGDYLLSCALSLITGKDTKMEGIIVSNALGRLCMSELEQDAGQGNFFITEQEYFKRIAGKTAALFALSCYAGASVAKLPPEMKNRCHRIGHFLGMAFQIQDDILDYTGSEMHLGKKTGNDLRCGIPTLPLLLALKSEKEQASKEFPLKKLLTTNKKLGQTDVKKAVSLVSSLGGVDQAKKIADTYGNRALIDIQSLQDEQVCRQLTSLFTRLSVRST
ncbi:polyprenyl synthetase family protein [uncultured Sphaerochaeta sp.]|uniref:polyprenyl synthetase family protein n=1 Tax=uncultured Sphaerochaeta sp. TaxID=886478 RepID=UPI002A0A4233|nr:polyprenyl synthetase family protein [uncultured Sphaerochaeta sp.]